MVNPCTNKYDDASLHNLRMLKEYCAILFVCGLE